MDENTNVEINDVSNTSGNIGQNNSADSLFQPAPNNNSSLDLTYIDRALTPVKSETEDKPTGYKVVKGSEAYAGFGRAAGGDGDSSDDDHDNETISEGIERSKQETERMNERTRKENESRERERAERERAEKARERAEKEAKRERAKEHGNDNEPSGTGSSEPGLSEGGSYSDSGAISYSDNATNEAVDNLISTDAKSNKANAEVNKASEAYTKAAENTIAAGDRYNQAQENAKALNDLYNDMVSERQNMEAKLEQDKFLLGADINDINVNKLTNSDLKVNEINTNGASVSMDITQHTKFVGGIYERDQNKINITVNADGTVTVKNTNLLTGKESTEQYPNVDAATSYISALSTREGDIQSNLKDLIQNAAKLQEQARDIRDQLQAEEQMRGRLADAQAELEAATKAAQEAIAAQDAAAKVLDKALGEAEVASKEFTAALEKYNEVSGAANIEREEAGENVGSAAKEAADALKNGLNNDGNSGDTNVVKETINRWLNGDNDDHIDILDGTLLGDIKQDIETIINGFDSEVDGNKYREVTEGFVKNVSDIISSKSSWFDKLTGIFGAFKTWLNELRSTFYSRKEGKIVDFIRSNVRLGIRIALALLTGGGTIAAELLTDMGRIMWNSLRSWIKGDLVNAGWELDGIDSDGSGEAFWNDIITVTDPDFSGLTDPFNNLYGNQNVNKNYSDYNYGLEGKQKGQLYSDEEIKSFINTVVRKSPVKYIPKFD